ncbi:MAG: SDR family NAD(P)-dependent oxidoreductase [Acetobacteraceae bacterium]
MQSSFPIGTALITGASSGIGAALAIALARPDAILHLSGRHEDRLARIAHACATRGATVHTRVLDVRDAAAMADWIAGAGRLDLVIANAGIAPGNHGIAGETSEQTRAVIATNLDGALNTVLPALQVMRRQPAALDGRRGRIAVIASIAAFIPVPGAAAYCASKAAIDTWVVAHAPAAARDGVQLASVCPGWIRTPMIAGIRHALPGVMEPDRAAQLILRGVLAGRTRVVFPRWLAMLARFGALLPPALLGRLAAGKTGGSA